MVRKVAGSGHLGMGPGGQAPRAGDRGLTQRPGDGGQSPRADGDCDLDTIDLP
jgi:hypothetical protein